MHEMELVNQMLQAAMAEEGDEEDEVKEEYGKRMDENLASLRLKLEEARRTEGKPPIEGPDPSVVVDHQDGPLTVKNAENTHGQAIEEETTSLRAALSTSEEKVRSFQIS